MIHFEALTTTNWPKYHHAIIALEQSSFSPAQCHPAEFYFQLLADPRQVSHIALEHERLIGFSVSAPLERFANIPGVTQDPQFNLASVLYGADMVVDSSCRKKGIGKKFKALQMAQARLLGYRFLAGRNRLHFAEAMWCVNQSLGAIEIQRLKNIYQDGREPNECIYYHIAINN